MTRFLLDTHRDGDVLVVALCGEIDMATAPVMLTTATTALAQIDVASLRMDMSQVSFLDSSGLSALVQVHKAARERRKSVVVCKLQAGPRRVIEFAGLDTLLMIEPHTDAS